MQRRVAPGNGGIAGPRARGRYVTSDLRLALAGDRALAVHVLDYLVGDAHTRPVALLLPKEGRASHDSDLLARCPDLGPDAVFRGQAFRTGAGISRLRSLNLDYLISIHFPYLLPPEVIEIPRYGCLNLHPSLLPYNRGWHTASWALLERTPIGATLHFIDEGMDTGDIAHQRSVEIEPGDTAHTLYQRVVQAEMQVFREAWPQIASGRHERRPQPAGKGSMHKRGDLLHPSVQELRLSEEGSVEQLLRRLRALTTSRIDEACYYEQDGRRFRVQVRVTEEPLPPERGPHR